MNQNVVAQLHHELVDALRRTRPAALTKSVTVAEIYQDLVPYKAARNTIGFELNADYEHALLRLLAGEGDLARIEPREVRDKLRLELESPNPNVGIFRDYAACDVWVDVGDGIDEEVVDESWEDEFLGPETKIAEPEVIQAALGSPFEIAAKQPEPEPVPLPEPEPEPEPEPVIEDEPAAVVNERPHHMNCSFCGGELPDERMVNYCPFCGSDQTQQPCPNCGELLDPLWRFCITCGTRVKRLGDHLN
jgi:hypothetical protein